MTFEKGIELFTLFIAIVGGVYGVVKVTVLPKFEDFKDSINKRFDTFENNYNARICNLERTTDSHTEKLFVFGEKIAKMEGKHGKDN
jgi:hypothetical protein